MHARLQSCFLCAALLTIKDLAKVRHLTFQASSRWHDIGLALGLQEPALEIIRHDFQTADECHKKMLSEWLKMITPAPTLETLIAALKQPYVGFPHLVQDVQEEFGLSASPSDNSASGAGEDCLAITCNFMHPHCVYVLVAGTVKTTTHVLSAEEVEGEYQFWWLIVFSPILKQHTNYVYLRVTIFASTVIWLIFAVKFFCGSVKKRNLKYFLPRIIRNHFFFAAWNC